MNIFNFKKILNSKLILFSVCLPNQFINKSCIIADCYDIDPTSITKLPQPHKNIH